MECTFYGEKTQFSPILLHEVVLRDLVGHQKHQMNRKSKNEISRNVENGCACSAKDEVND